MNMRWLAAQCVRGLLPVAALLVVSGCASQLGSVTPLPPLPAHVKSQLGKNIGVTTPGARAAFSFEPSSGRAGTAGEGAVNGLSAMAQAAAGADEGVIVAVALLPVAALVGAIVEVNKTLPAEEVRKSELELAAGLRAAADQREFREQFLQVALRRANPKFLRVPAARPARIERAGSPRPDSGADSILELSVVDLRLQRTSLTDASYALVIHARVRLILLAGDGVVYDAPVQFQSATSLFSNWTLDRGTPLRRVAEFGYRSIAEQIIAQLFVETSS